jgi:hypothetical protein
MNRILYTLVISNNKYSGNYYGTTPKQAVSKAFSKLCRTGEIGNPLGNNYTICIFDKINKLTYLYNLERIKLQQPIIRNIGNKQIIYNYKNKVYFLKKIIS